MAVTSLVIMCNDQLHESRIRFRVPVELCDWLIVICAKNGANILYTIQGSPFIVGLVRDEKELNYIKILFLYSLHQGWGTCGLKATCGLLSHKVRPFQ